jgi:outer membrane protein assembly factor BamB
MLLVDSLDSFYLTVAYDATTGTQLWAAGENLAPEQLYGATAITVDGRGTVYVTGFTVSPTGSIYSTIAYDATNGARRWRASYYGPCNGFYECISSPRALAVDGRGTVFVTGSSSTGPFSGGSPFFKGT